MQTKLPYLVPLIVRRQIWNFCHSLLLTPEDKLFEKNQIFKTKKIIRSCKGHPKMCVICAWYVWYCKIMQYNFAELSDWEGGFYWGNRPDILQQFLILTSNLSRSRKTFPRKTMLSAYLGEHADNVGVQRVLLLQLCVGWDRVVDGNRSLPLPVPAFIRTSACISIFLAILGNRDRVDDNFHL